MTPNVNLVNFSFGGKDHAGIGIHSALFAALGLALIAPGVLVTIIDGAKK